MLSSFAKKSLGQNFLKSEKALKDIVSAGSIQDNETIVEIGPGQGALTDVLLQEARKKEGVKIICIEKDDRLIPILNEKYSRDIKQGLLTLVHADIIDVFQKGTFSSLVAHNSYKVVANIPYYITGLIIRYIFSEEELPRKVVLLVQKEVANRIMSYGDHGETIDTGNESLLSISVKLYGTPHRVSVVPKGAFVPAPTVDSAILAIDNIHRKIEKHEEELFFQFLHLAFSHKRKRLIKNIETFSTASKKHSVSFLESTFIQLGLDINTRAEELSVEKYIQLFKRLI